MVKRGVDILIAALLLVFSSPILILAGLIIRFESPGPVLFQQERMGRGFRRFRILKLRTMAHAKSGALYTLGADPRITPFGRWLRRTKLDELPQLWNVLRGEMSLVGPRPVVPELTEEFHFHYRLLLRERPGLTDPASLKYSQEAHLLELAPDAMRFFKTVVTPDKIRISTEYLERANVWTDLTTLLMTGVICCFPSLSRVYGPLPNARRYPPEVNLQPLPVSALADMGMELPVWAKIDPALAAVNGSTFRYELAMVEAEAEKASEVTASPWIPLEIATMGGQSAAGYAQDRASQL